MISCIQSLDGTSSTSGASWDSDFVVESTKVGDSVGPSPASLPGHPTESEIRKSGIVFRIVCRREPGLGRSVIEKDRLVVVVVVVVVVEELVVL